MTGRRWLAWLPIRHAARASAAAGATLLLCAPAPAEQSYYVDHDLGFSIPVAVAAAVESRIDGFIVHPHGSLTVRAPITIEVIWSNRPDTAPPIPLNRTRLVNGATAHYGESEITVGSGGTEYLLVARRELCGGVLDVRQREQYEQGPSPDYIDAWHIVEWARCALDRD